MKTLQTIGNSKDTLLASYLKETSVVDFSDKYRVDWKCLGRSVLASMQRLKQSGEAGRKY